MKYLKVLCTIAFSVSVFTACGGNTDKKGMGGADSTQVMQKIQPGSQMMQQGETVFYIVSGTNSLSLFNQAVMSTGLTDSLSASGPYTIFAPSNEAFNALDEGKLDELMKPENKDKLVSVLKHHIVSGAIASTSLQDGQMLPTLAGSELEVSVSSDSLVTINGAGVSQTATEASNGVVYVIDEVLISSM